MTERQRILVTGANGHLGRRLIANLPENYAIEAVVRSESAERRLVRSIGDRENVTITRTDPSDSERLKPIAARCHQAVHLIGTIKARRDNRIEDAHQIPASALASAVSQSTVEHIIYLSILGAHENANSHCLRSRAAVERILSGSGCSTTTIRVPMVLGEGDRASRALKYRSRRRFVTVFRGGSLEQPIYAGDVIQAVTASLKRPSRGSLRHFDLAGPESLTRTDLIRRAGTINGYQPVVISLPITVGMILAGISEKLSPMPPITRDMLRILDHDDNIDTTLACQELKISLTGLGETLRRCVTEP